MKPSNYVYSPNNIFGIDGKEILPAGPGIKMPAFPLLAFDMGDSIQIFSNIHGKPCELNLCLCFDTVEQFESYCEKYGHESEPGLPPFYNSDI